MGKNFLGHPCFVVPMLYTRDIPRERGKTLCEDFPCCGHERGDCNGGLYGSDESIIQAEYDRMAREDYDDYYS